MTSLNALDGLFKQLGQEIDKEVSDKTDKKIAEFKEFVTKEVKKVEELASANVPLTVKTERGTNTVKGLKHKNLTKLIKVAGQGIPSLLVGMAGTGKTHAGEQVAEALGLDFFTMSVGAQTSKSDIMGFVHAGGAYIPSLFRIAYETGGVFLMDEIDAGNANVLIQVNSALSNSVCSFPDKMVKKHKDFVFIASANTYGQGANRMYVGRNQLDSATLDRFAIIDWDVDNKLEEQLAGDDETAKKWYKVVKHLRGLVQQDGMRALVTPRATIKGRALFEVGLSFDEVLEHVILGGIPLDKQSRIKTEAKSVWSNN